MGDQLGGFDGFGLMTLYAVNSWQDIDFVDATSKTYYYSGTMYCTDDYDESCDIDDLSPYSWQCKYTTDVCYNTTAHTTKAPTFDPTASPTMMPTPAPTNVPSSGPTEDPSSDPTTQPSFVPSNDPTAAPTERPTDSPTNSPVIDGRAETTSEEQTTIESEADTVSLTEQGDNIYRTLFLIAVGVGLCACILLGVVIVYRRKRPQSFTHAATDDQVQIEGVGSSRPANTNIAMAQVGMQGQIVMSMSHSTVGPPNTPPLEDPNTAEGH